MTVVPYRPLEEATLEGIVVAKLEKLRERYKAATGKQFDFDPAIVKAVLQRGGRAGYRERADGAGDGEVGGVGVGVATSITTPLLGQAATVWHAH